MTYFENQLFQECIEALDKKATILTPKDSNKIFALLEQDVPFTAWGKVNWNNIQSKVIIDSPKDIVSSLESLKKPLDLSVYVMWNDAFVPVVQTDLESIEEHFFAIVALETWFFNPFQGYIIEVLANYEIKAGLVPVRSELQ